MAFDGIALHSIINELQVLVGGKVNQIRQPNNNNITISVYAQKIFLINIDTSASNYRLHLSTHSKPSPYQAPNFCMLLRKYLIGGKIQKIYMTGLERICYIDFECFNEMNDKITRTLVIELMGKYSNVILLNENRTVIDALKKFDIANPFEDSHSSSRSIMPARKYIEPLESKCNFELTSFSDFEKIVNSSELKTLESSIPALFTGISKMFIQGALEKLQISNTVGHNNLVEIYDYINNIIKRPNFTYFNIFKNNYNIYFDELEHPNPSDLSINYALDDFYFEKIENEVYYLYRNNLLKVLSGTLDKLTNKLNNINNKISLCDDMNKYQLYGELLIANIYRYKNLYSEYVEVENYHNNNVKVKIKINPNISLSQNAEKYFKKYNKMKNTIRISEIQKKETEIELKYLEGLVEQLDLCTNISDVDRIYENISQNILFSDIKFKKKNKTKKVSPNDTSINNYMRLKIDGFDVFIGKNNRQNDYLTLKVANSNDYWFHTKDIHGSHLILRCNGEMPKLSTIKQCAKLAAYYSKAKFSSHVPVDYTLVKYVKKPNGSVPGYVIYTNNKTIFIDPENISLSPIGV